ncbi:MAG: 4'-phosphopantetheinyl transferase superfamily protein [Candidatus Aminicenantes bacterium]|nr:4'-phosphopantetheinyl transferase superfamily protein [Candidatus Aminicenantes bacterium]
MIEIYAVNIAERKEKGVVVQMLPFVDKHKQNRINRFLNWEDSLRSLTAELLARYIIIRKTGLRNEDIVFSHNGFGKPVLQNRDNFHFNLTHSGDWIACAVDSNPVGIDIERIEPLDLDNISRRYFSEDEHRYLLSQSDRLAHFFMLWTLKESYVKMEGKGLHLPLDSFSMRFGSGNGIGIEFRGKELDDRFFCRYDIDSSYKMAICAQSREFPRSVIRKSVDELVESFLSLGGIR